VVEVVGGELRAAVDTPVEKLLPSTEKQLRGYLEIQLEFMEQYHDISN
jgi:hypothetical protein